MDIHKNARSCPKSRELLVKRVIHGGWSVRAAAAAAGLSERQVYRWLARVRAGEPLEDRSSRPRRLGRVTPQPTVDSILALRRERQVAAEIAVRVGIPRSTVAAILVRHQLGRLKLLEPKEPARRYEKALPGELLHLDIKKLARIARPGHRVTGSRRGQATGVGYDVVHVCVDDATRIAYAEILENECQEACCGFLERAVAWYRRLGIDPQAALTDNGPGYKSRLFAATCQRLGLRHRRTRPFRPRTNGKVERLIQTLLREWAYRFVYNHSTERAARLSPYLSFYNRRRAYHGLGKLTPFSRLAALNNVSRHDS
jgi:transposase InsO family protein